MSKKNLMASAFLFLSLLIKRTSSFWRCSGRKLLTWRELCWTAFYFHFSLKKSKFFPLLSQHKTVHLVFWKTNLRHCVCPSFWGRFFMRVKYCLISRVLVEPMLPSLDGEISDAYSYISHAHKHVKHVAIISKYRDLHICTLTPPLRQTGCIFTTAGKHKSFSQHSSIFAQCLTCSLWFGLTLAACVSAS